MRKLTVMSLLLLMIGQNVNAQLWQTVGAGFDSWIKGFGSDDSANILYVGGSFKYSDTTYLGQVAYLDGNSWMPLDSGLGCAPFSGGEPSYFFVHDSLLFMGGTYFRCDDYTYFLHAWNGISWTSFGTTNAFVILGKAEDELFAMGAFDTLANEPINRIGKWTGAGWEQFGDTTFLKSIYLVATIASFKGKFYLGGNFNTWPDPSEIAMWDGVQWSVPGGGVKGDSWVNCSEVYDSLLWVAGLFERSAGNAGNHVMTWDGTQWADPLPNVYFTTQVRDMRLWGGELYFQGTHYVYTNGAWQGPRYIGKYDGTQFCSFGGPDLPLQGMGYLNGRLFGATIYVPGQEIYGYCAEWIGGNQMDFCVQQGPLSNEPKQSDARLVVFPNPATDHVEVHLEAGRIVEIRLVDLLGRDIPVAVQMYGATDAAIVLEGLPAGTYLIQCRTEEGVVSTTKFVKR